MGFDAEYSYVPTNIQTKPDFYAHVLANLKSLLQETSVDGQQLKTNWVRLTDCLDKFLDGSS